MTIAPDGRWPGGLGLVGAGAMGRALLDGLVRAHPWLGRRTVVCDVVAEAAHSAADAVGGRAVALPEAVAVDLVVVAVKPKDVGDVLAAARAAEGPPGIVCSIAAGWPLARLAEGLGGTPRVVRAMPNLAVRHGAGVVGVASRGLSDAETARVMALLAPLGAALTVPESLFPAITALAGSGPGLCALVAEGLEEGAVAAGIARVEARALVQGVLAGTAALLADGSDPAVLRQRVSSPGGTTVEAVAVLERGGVRAHLADAIRAAARRAAELE